MRHTSILHLRLSRKEGCSNQAPKEQVNNNSLNIEENIPSMDNMLLDFGSRDMFGDLE
jgi:hypothetical protein